jgi:hypothetical protein
LPLFLLIFFSISCAAQQVQADFYLGLLANEGHIAGAYFEKALKSPNAYIRTAAAAELLRYYSQDREIPVVLLNRLKTSSPPSWAKAFEVLGAEPDQIKEKALAFLLGSGQSGTMFFSSTFHDEAARYTLRECLTHHSIDFSPAEIAAIDGSNAVSKLRYYEALSFFRITMEDSDLFFIYPELLSGLGRAFQYGGAGKAGIELFLDWEKSLLSRPVSDAGNIQYLLLF